jgi:diguanylate cyclase (GGDEF)-like protein
MYDTKLDGAMELCTSIQKNIRSVGDFESQGVKIGPITLSFGIASMVPHHLSICENLIKSADLALYKAKENGRDCIVTDRML